MPSTARRGLRRFVVDNGLSIVCFVLFAVFLCAQSLTGWQVHNADATEHGGRAIAYFTYLSTGHFFEAVFENWESEFLQMAAFVLLTAFLIQRGSAESKHPDEDNEVDEDPRVHARKARSPWPVRRGGIWLRLYENSLLLAFVTLFLVSIIGHGLGGVREYNSEQRDHHEPEISTLEYVRGARFWFESFQNWQSEFLAVGSIVVLTIFLRQRGSPESKPVAMSNSDMRAA
jgi:hypothetical protein